MTTHYVLIDNNSGFVWEEADAENPIEACRIVDNKVGPGDSREYEVADYRFGGTNTNGYIVCEAPDDWASVTDGQDPDEIERVTALPVAAYISFRAVD